MIGEAACWSAVPVVSAEAATSPPPCAVSLIAVVTRTGAPLGFSTRPPSSRLVGLLIRLVARRGAASSPAVQPRSYRRELLGSCSARGDHRFTRATPCVICRPTQPDIRGAGGPLKPADNAPTSTRPIRGRATPTAVHWLRASGLLSVVASRLHVRRHAQITDDWEEHGTTSSAAHDDAVPDGFVPRRRAQRAASPRHAGDRGSCTLPTCVVLVTNRRCPD